MDFHGPIEEQECGIQVDPLHGELTILMNGGMLVRLHLSSASWRRLRDDANKAIEAEIAAALKAEAAS